MATRAGGLPRAAVRLSGDALRQVRGGHPWVFDSSIRSVRPAGGAAIEDLRAGSLAVIFDDSGAFVAIGLWDPDSPIRIRVLHRGGPTPIDGEFFAERVEFAAQRRSGLSPDTTGWRVVNGENDALPGLVLDRYDDTLVLKLYSAAWFPHLDQVLDAVVASQRPRRVVLRLARVVARAAPDARDGSGRRLADGVTLVGDEPREPVRFTENGLVFEADVVHGQKTGYFLDQRDNRARVRAMSDGADVLDVYCASGGFTVHAAAGGARSVHSVDISPGAIAATARNLAHNSGIDAVRRCEHRATTGDAMDALAAAATRGERYDLVVVDPPSFASKQHQVPAALRAYQRLTTLAVALVRPGGHLVQASCSARVGTDAFVDAVTDAALAAGRSLAAPEVTGHALDHPVGFAQGAYLKAVFARVEDRTAAGARR